MNSIASTTTTTSKFEGFDFLRAIFVVIVVGIHADLFNLLSGKPRLNHLVDIWNSNVGSIAVPIFLQMSIFLFYLKREEFGHQYFQKRLPKLIYLYIFWVFSFLAVKVLFSSELEMTQTKFLSFNDVIKFVVSGGGTIFYFFFSLIFLTIVAEALIAFYEKINDGFIKVKINYWLFFTSCILIFSFPIIDIIVIQHVLLTQVFSPLSFLPYIFTTAIIAHDLKEGGLRKTTLTLKLKLYGLFALYLFFTILEWVIFKDFSTYSRYFPNYSKISLVFMSWLLMYLALLSKQRVPSVIRLLSSCSLGIYGFHSFFTSHMTFLLSLSKKIPGSGTLMLFFVSLCGSIALTLIFKRIKGLKNFV